MTRAQWLFATLCALLCAALYLQTGGDRPDAAPAPADGGPPGAAQSAPPDSAGDAPKITAVRATAVDGEADRAAAAGAVQRWLQEIGDDDPERRAAAIAALAGAPREQAVPALLKVLGSGADLDRQLALNALRTLASDQGDAGGEIRTALRLAIYDGGDEVVAVGAQIALDDVEHEIGEKP